MRGGSKISWGTEPEGRAAMPPEPPRAGHDGELIRRARERMVPRLSIAAAAALTGDSVGNWGHIERGYQSMADGTLRSTTHPPAATLARMASVVGVTPAELTELGQRHGSGCHAGEAAEILAGILDERRREAAALTAALADADEAFLRVIRLSPDLDEQQKADLVRMWRQGGRAKVAEVAAKMLRGLDG